MECLAKDKEGGRKTGVKTLVNMQEEACPGPGGEKNHYAKLLQCFIPRGAVNCRRCFPRNGSH